MARYRGQNDRRGAEMIDMTPQEFYEYRAMKMIQNLDIEDLHEMFSDPYETFFKQNFIDITHEQTSFIIIKSSTFKDAL